MTEEQFNKAIELNGELGKLYRVKKEINGMETHKLAYIEKRYRAFGDTGDDWKLCDVGALGIIGRIFERHDIQIRQEIEDEINRIKQEIEKL